MGIKIVDQGMGAFHQGEWVSIYTVGEWIRVTVIVVRLIMDEFTLGWT